MQSCFNVTESRGVIDDSDRLRGTNNGNSCTELVHSTILKFNK